MSAQKKSRTELLQEALLLEQMNGEWTIAHAAAFCMCSETFIYRSSCVKLKKDGDRNIAGKSMIRLLPADVRSWNNARTQAAA